MLASLICACKHKEYENKEKGGFSVAAVIYPGFWSGLAFDLGADSRPLIALGAALGVRRNSKLLESLRRTENAHA